MRDHPDDNRETRRTNQKQRDDPIEIEALELSPIKEVVHAIIKDVIRKEHRQNKDWMKTVPQRNDRD